MDRETRDASQPVSVPAELDKVLAKYSRQYISINRIGRLWQSEAADDTKANADSRYTYKRDFFESVQSTSFDATSLQKIVEEIELIEEGLKSLIAARTKKIVKERISVEKERPVKYGFIRRALKALGLIGQKMETYIDYETVKKEVPKKPDDVFIAEFRTMIDRYIDGLRGLNRGLHETVTEVDDIVRNLTHVSDAYTDDIHRCRKAYYKQILYSRELETQLEEIVALHESMSPLNDRYPEVEKARDHMEMALRESQSMEFKYKTSIDMNVNYQAALKSYRKLINDFKERGDIHVNMVDKFAEGASHMKIAVDNVSQICSGIAKVTQSMVMIVESIEGGNQVLGRYAALIGDPAASSRQWDMKYDALKEAEAIYQKNDAERMRELEDNRLQLENFGGA